MRFHLGHIWMKFLSSWKEVIWQALPLESVRLTSWTILRKEYWSTPTLRKQFGNRNGWRAGLLSISFVFFRFLLAFLFRHSFQCLRLFVSSINFTLWELFSCFLFVDRLLRVFVQLSSAWKRNIGIRRQMTIRVMSWIKQAWDWSNEGSQFMFRKIGVIKEGIITRNKAAP